MQALVRNNQMMHGLKSASRMRKWKGSLLPRYCNFRRRELCASSALFFNVLPFNKGLEGKRRKLQPVVHSRIGTRWKTQVKSDPMDAYDVDLNDEGESILEYLAKVESMDPSAGG